MKILKKIFDIYIKISKIITTYLGIIAIYSIGIPLGKIMFSFSPKVNHHKWVNYQPGSSPDKMF